VETEIKSTSDNPLLGRKEIKAVVSFNGATPNRKEIKETICGKVGANPDLTVVREVKGEFGMKRVSVTAHVYENADKLKSVEPEHIKKREGVGQEKPEEKKEGAAEETAEAPKEEKPAEEAPKEEKPAEEKKEEAPAEEKKE